MPSFPVFYLGTWNFKFTCSGLTWLFSFWPVSSLNEIFEVNVTRISKEDAKFVFKWLQITNYECTCRSEDGKSNFHAKKSTEPDLNQWPKDLCYAYIIYSPPLYQLSYRWLCKGNATKMHTRKAKRTEIFFSKKKIFGRQSSSVSEISRLTRLD